MSRVPSERDHDGAETSKFSIFLIPTFAKSKDFPARNKMFLSQLDVSRRRAFRGTDFSRRHKPGMNAAGRGTQT